MEPDERPTDEEHATDWRGFADGLAAHIWETFIPYPLAPLDPDQFLRWAWRRGDQERGTSPLTLEDIHYEMRRHDPGLPIEKLRRAYVGLAARVRHDQRRGRLDRLRGVV